MSEDYYDTDESLLVDIIRQVWSIIQWSLVSSETCVQCVNAGAWLSDISDEILTLR